MHSHSRVSDRHSKQGTQIFRLPDINQKDIDNNRISAGLALRLIVSALAMPRWTADPDIYLNEVKINCNTRDD
ncbi:hypothetical protein GCM10007978_35410 [Shewanella hanedai]|nr:hypothetical protein GCM10007978_35410 [Shewanella hanedai]